MKFKEKLRQLIPTRRKIVQLYFALLFNANIRGFVSGNIYQGNTKKMCVPGINCYSCPGAVGACPLGSLQGSFSADRSTLYYVGGILLLYCILFGRLICGWLCPFGLIQELLYKIKTPKLKKSPVTRILSYLKYVILVFFVFIVPIMYAFRDTPLPTFCKYICPAGTIEGGLGLLSNKVNAGYFSMLGPLFTWKFILMISIVLGSIFVFRLFCRFLCPLGALYGLFNKISLFGIKLEKGKCTHCNKCVNKCKVDIKEVGDQECISCGECIDECPTKAISWKGSKIFLKDNEVIPTEGEITPEQEAIISSKTKQRKTLKLVCRIVSWAIMIAILVGAIVYFWKDTEPDSAGSTNPPATSAPDSTDSPDTPSVPLGNQVGQLCYGYDLQIIDSTGITGETINPSKTQKVTVINFWGTWCTPCVNELPYFDRIATEYGDDVTVIAIHTDMVHQTAFNYVKGHYPDSDIVFAKDYKDGDTEGYYTTLGGRGTYPYTVVLRDDGVISSVFLSSLEYDELKAAVEKALNE